MAKLCGVQLSSKSETELLQASKLTFVATMNAALFVEYNEGGEAFRRYVDNAECTLDGQVPFWAAKLKAWFVEGERSVKVSKISGSDLIYKAAEYSGANRRKLYILGGAKFENQLAVDNLSRLYGADVDGDSPIVNPSALKDDHIMKKIELFRPDYLFVCLGAPLQEEWALANKDAISRCGVKLVVGAGGSVDFASGLIKRAPNFVQALGFESIFRLIQEPNRKRILRLIKSIRFFLYLFANSR